MLVAEQTLCFVTSVDQLVSPFEDRENTASAAIQRASLAQSQAAPRQAGYMARLNTILCQ
jgi:hypothetical protein